MRFPLLVLALLLAGCAAPAPGTGAEEGGPVDLTGRSGTFLVDLREGAVQPLSTRATLAWMSPSGAVVTWQEPDFAAVLLRSSGAREVAALRTWAHVSDDATGVELAPALARVRHVVTGTELSNATLPAEPAGRAWTRASADLGVLAGEYAPARPTAPCRNEIVILAGTIERATGCHVRVGPDGRVAWAEEGAIRVRATDGTTRALAAPPSMDGVFVAHENPVFAGERVLYLRLQGEGTLERTEIVDETGASLARMEGARRLALLDVSADGRWLLASAFDAS